MDLNAGASSLGVRPAEATTGNVNEQGQGPLPLLVEILVEHGVHNVRHDANQDVRPQSDNVEAYPPLWSAAE